MSNPLDAQVPVEMLWVKRCIVDILVVDRWNRENAEAEATKRLAALESRVATRARQPLIEALEIIAKGNWQGRWTEARDIAAAALAQEDAK